MLKITSQTCTMSTFFKKNHKTLGLARTFVGTKGLILSQSNQNETNPHWFLKIHKKIIKIKNKIKIKNYKF